MKTKVSFQVDCLIFFLVIISVCFLYSKPALADTPVSLVLTASANPIEDGRVLEFTATVANNSSATVSNVVLQAVVPMHFYDMQSNKSSPTWSLCTSGTYCNTGDVMEWQLGDLVPGEVRTIRFWDHVDSAAVEGSLITAQANVNVNGSMLAQTERTVVVSEDSAKLELTVQASDNPVVAGASLSYQLQFSNQSGQNITSGTLSAALPVGVNLVSASDGGTESDGSVHWPLTGMQAGLDGVRSLTVLIDTGLSAGQLLLLDASLIATLADGSVQETRSTEVVAVSLVPTPLELTLTASANPIEDGRVLEFTATVANNSSATVSNVVLQAVVPMHFYDMQSNKSSPTWSLCTSGTYCNTGDVMEWQLGDLVPGEVRTIRFWDHVDSAAVEGSLITAQANVNVNGSMLAQTERTVVVSEDAVISGEALDRDLDTIRDIFDNCPFVPNTSQLDFDNDGRGDVCDVASTTISPVQVKITNEANLYVRESPSVNSSIVTEVRNDQQYVAFEQSVQGSDIWYRIYLPCGNTGWCAAWIAGVYQGTTYSVEESLGTQAEIINTGNLGLNVRVNPGSSVRDSVYDGQRFVIQGSAPSGDGCFSNWYQIDTPLSSLTATGWVCGDFLHLLSTIPSPVPTLSGNLTGPAGIDLPGINVDLTGATTLSTNPDAGGQYVFSNLVDGSYTITPDLAGYTFSPASHTKTLSGTSVSGLDFRACQEGQNLTGSLTDQNRNPLTSADAIITASGVTGTIDNNGNYSINGLSCKTHTIKLIPVGSSEFPSYTLDHDTFTSWTRNIQVTPESTVFDRTSSTGRSPDPVNTATGNYYYQHQDLLIPGIAMPLGFERNYNSRDQKNGPLGYNWMHNWNTSLVIEIDGNITIRWGDGSTKTWSPDGIGGFTPQSAVFDTLIDEGGGAYTLQKKNLIRYQFNTSGQLVSVTDKNNNAISLSYIGSELNTIVDTAGRNIDFTYDTAGRITVITDPIARTVQFGYDANGDLITATDPNGNITTYHYDSNHQIISIIDPRGNEIVNNTYDAVRRVVTYQTDAKGGQTIFNYEETNRTTTFTDALGNLTTHVHDSMLRLTKEEDANGGFANYKYDTAGNRIQITDKNGNITKYEYDERGNVISKINAQNNTTTITYDANDNPLIRTDALGNKTTFSYDPKGNVELITDALMHTTSFTYDPNGLPLTITDARGNTSTNTYDIEGNLEQVKDALNQATSFTYDGVGRRLSKTDALTRTTTYSYDDNNNLLTITDPTAKVITYAYDENDNRVSSTNRNNNTTTFSYDEKDLLTTTTDPLTNTVVNGYDALDRRTTLKDKNANTTQYHYDGIGNLIKVIDALTNETKFTYDPNGNRLSTTDPLYHSAESTYDQLNRRIATRDALGNTTQTVYDEVGRVIATSNAKNQTTSFEYDVLGRLLKVTDANNGIVNYGYDENGNRISMQEPNANITTYEYDALNRLNKKNEPLGNITQYGYDAVGNLQQLIKPNGTIIQYSYNELDRLNTITYPDSSTVSFDYDANGNRLQMLDSLGTQSYSYDKLNRMLFHSDPFGNTVGYGYDDNGNRTTLVYPGNNTVTYGYDVLNRMATVTDWLVHTTTYNYDVASRLVSTTNPNGTTAAYSYDKGNRLSSLVNAKSDASVISSYIYTLDKIGNQLQESRNEPLGPVLTPGTVAYSYDEENRMTAIDGIANSFDDNGNMIAKDSDAYNFDYEDRLIQTTIGGNVTNYGYDGLGDRYFRTNSEGTTRFILDTNTNLTNVIAEADASNAISGYYIYGLGLISRINADGTTRYYHFDSRGSTVALTDQSQVMTDSYAYDPFGKLVNQSGISQNAFTYLGGHGVMDEGDDLLFIRARYYDKGVGRFVSKDLLEGSENNGQSINLYNYVLNNPIQFIDVSGFMATEGGVVQIEKNTLTDINLLEQRNQRLIRFSIGEKGRQEALFWELERIKYERNANILQGIYDALGSFNGLITGGPKGAISGLSRQFSTLADITGHETVGKFSRYGANIIDIYSSVSGVVNTIKSATILNPAINDTGIKFKNILRVQVKDPVGKLYLNLIKPSAKKVGSSFGEFLGKIYYHD